MQVFPVFLQGVRAPSPWKILKTKNAGEDICGHFAMQLPSMQHISITLFRVLSKGRFI